MSNMFDKFVNRSYIIPIADDKKNIIRDCCENIIADISVAEFEALCMSFLFGEVNQIITPKIREAASAQSISIRISPAFIKNVAQYIVGAVFESEEIDDETKADCSLVLRNAILSLKSDHILIPCPDYLKKGVEFYDSYYGSMAKIKTPETFELTPEILHAASIDDLQTIDLQDCFKEIQYYSRVYARKQYDIQTERIAQECQNIEGSFEKAFYIADKLSKQDWIYVDENPISTIKKLLTVKNTRVAMVRIKEEVTSGEVFNQPASIHNSSLLLQYLSYNSRAKYLDKVKFSPIEFAVALYYEFVFELKQE